MKKSLEKLNSIEGLIHETQLHSKEKVAQAAFSSAVQGIVFFL